MGALRSRRIGLQFFNVPLRHRAQEVSMSRPIAKAPIPEPEQRSLELTEDIIRASAYQFYEERGCEDGHDLEDWLRAETEIVGKELAAA